MKFKNYILSVFAAVLLLNSCRSDDPDPTPPPTSTELNKINDFVWKAMNSWYYWQPNVPQLGDNYFKTQAEYATYINSKTPDGLFYDLLYQYGTVDRFSWIENNNKIVEKSAKRAEIEKSAGFDYAIYYKGATGTAVVALINYVIPNSPAATAGLKRGDVITRVNGAALTESNYSQLENDQFTINLAATVEYVAGVGVVTTDNPNAISLTNADIDENPVAFYKRFDLAGKRIGYLVYNGFRSDYNDELNQAFLTMKAEGVNELVLDLRYNGGGSLETAAALAQMINGSFTGQPYVYLDFNNKHNDEDGFDYLKDKVRIYNSVNNNPEFAREEAVNSLALPKIYVLVSFQTASASELTVQCMGEFIEIVTVGYDTVGKYVGSITLYDSPAQQYTSFTNRNTAHNWQLQPITFSYLNKNKEPNPTEIVPNYRLNPYLSFGNIKEFGNTSDPVLKKALELITGQTINKSVYYGDSAPIRTSFISKTSFDNGSKGLNIHDFENFKKKRTK